MVRPVPVVKVPAPAMEVLPVRVIVPAEVIFIFPDVVVWSVKLLEVTLNDDAAPDAMEIAPAVELPIPTAPVDVPVLMLVG